MRHFLMFGTHPLLSLAEAKAVLNGQKPDMVDAVAIFERDEWNGAWLQDRLAGVVKLGDIVATVPIKELSANRLADEIEARPRADRVLFGLTVVGHSAKAFRNLGIQIKKALKSRGRSARWVTGDDGAISPAAVTKCRLTDEGYDFVIVTTATHAAIGLTTHAQNADAWSKRDYDRPFRDATTGMLPPKLARMMVNLSGLGGRIGILGGRMGPPLLDPFCGAGTILMEAALMDIRPLVGSDLDARQVDGCKKNMDWLVAQNLINQDMRDDITLNVQDARDMGEVTSPLHIVTEGFLGKPLQGNEPLSWLQKQAREIEDLWRASLTSFANIQQPGDRIVCVWPVFVTPIASVKVDIHQDLAALGYRQLNPIGDWWQTDAIGKGVCDLSRSQHRDTPLQYARPDQHVKRTIIVLEKK